MSIQKRSTLKNWFRKGLTPTQAQFADAFDSFFHKNEDLIPLNNVQGLTAALETKKNELQQYLNSKLNEAIDELDGRVNDNSETTVSGITFGGNDDGLWMELTMLSGAKNRVPLSIPLATTEHDGMMSSDDKQALNDVVESVVAIEAREVVEFDGIITQRIETVAQSATAPFTILYSVVEECFVALKGIQYYKSFEGSEQYNKNLSVLKDRTFLHRTTHKPWAWSETQGKLVTFSSDVPAGAITAEMLSEELLETLSNLGKKEVVMIDLWDNEEPGIMKDTINKAGVYYYKYDTKELYVSNDVPVFVSVALSGDVIYVRKEKKIPYIWKDGDMQPIAPEDIPASIFNATNEIPIRGYYVLCDATNQELSAVHAAWNAGKAVSGLIISFEIGAGIWKTYQYIGKTVTETNWINEENWKDFGSLAAGSEPYIIIDSLIGASGVGAYYTLATAVQALVAYQERTKVTYAKKGLIISYSIGENQMETKQFQGEVSDFGEVGLWKDFGGGGSDVETKDEPKKDGRDAFSTGGAYDLIPTNLEDVTEEGDTESRKIQMVNAAGDPIGDPVTIPVSTGGGGGGKIVSANFERSPFYASAGGEFVLRAAIRSVMTTSSGEDLRDIETAQIIDRDTQQVLATYPRVKGSSATSDTYDFEFDLSRYFTNAGTRRLQLKITDVDGATGSRSINVVAVDVTVESNQTLNYTASSVVFTTDTMKSMPMYKFPNNQGTEGITAKVEILIGGEWKVLGTANITDTYSHNISVNPNDAGGSSLSHGAYPIRIQGTDNASGVKGNIIYSTLMVVDPENTTPIVAIRYNDKSGGKVRLYDSVQLEVAAYQLGKNEVNLSVKENGTAITSVVAARNKVEAITKQISGVTDGSTLNYVAETDDHYSSNEIVLTVSGSAINAALSEGAIFNFDFANRTNQESGDHEIVSGQNGTYKITLEGANFSSNGFNKYLGANCLAVKENVEGGLNFTPFASSAIESSGLALLFQFATSHVLDSNARLMECYDENSGAGFYITGNVVGMYCKNGVAQRVERTYPQGEKITVGIVVEPGTKYIERNGTRYSMMKLFLNGEEAGCLGYIPGGSNLMQGSNVKWHGKKGDFYLYYLIGWQQAVEWQQEFYDYLVKLTNTDVMVGEYEFENVFDGSTANGPNVSKLASKGMPYVIEQPFNGSDINALDNTTSTKTKIYINLTYRDPSRPWRDFIAYNVQKRNQGTTSAKRPVKNPRYYLGKKKGSSATYTVDGEERTGTYMKLLHTREEIVAMGYDGALWDEAYALILQNKIRVGENTIPVDIITIKVDYSDSSNANDSGVCNMMNATYRALGPQYMTPAQRYYDGTWDKGDVHLTGLQLNHSTATHPVALYRDTSGTGAAMQFYSKGSWKEDKGEQVALGFIDTPGYNKGCLNYQDGTFTEYFGVRGETLDQIEARFKAETGLDTEKLYLLSLYCGSSYRFMKYESGEWRAQRGSMKQVNGKWVVEGYVLNPVEGFELLNYQGMDWFMGVGSIDDMMAPTTQTSSWVQKLVDSGDVSAETFPAWTQFFECMVDNDQLQIDYAMGRKVPYQLYRFLKFCDSCDYSKVANFAEIWHDNLYKYANPRALMVYDGTTDYLALTDQQAKNMQPMWFLDDGGSVVDGVYYYGGVATDDCAMRMYPNKVYDADTGNGKDNDGDATVDPEVDPNKPSDENTGYANPYAGWGSILWNNIYRQPTVLEDGNGTEVSMQTVVANMRNVQATVDGITLAPFSPEGAKHFFIDNIVKRWQKTVSSYDGERKYISFTSTSDAIYFYALHGLRLTSLPSFIDRRFRIRDGFYRTGLFFTGVFSARINAPAGAKIRIKAAKTGYFGIGNDASGNLRESCYLEAGESYNFSNFDHTEGTLLYIYQCDRLAELDLSEVSLSDNADFSAFDLIERLLIGGDGHVNRSIGSYNPLTVINFGELPFLKELDLRNTLITRVDVSKSPRLETVLASGSQLASLSLAETAPVNRMELPSTITELKMVNLPEISYPGGLTFDSLANLNRLHIDNCPKLDGAQLLTDAVSAGATIRFIRLANVAVTGPSNVLLDLKNFGAIGLDADGNAYDESGQCTGLTGRWVMSDFISDGYLSSLQAYFPEMEIHNSQYSHIYFNDDAGDPQNVTNADNQTGYEYSNEYQPSAHISKIWEDMTPVIGLYDRDSAKMRCIPLDPTDYKKLADGRVLENTYDKGEYDAFMLIKHYWYKGVNDFKNEKKHLFYSSVRNEPISSASVQRRMALADILFQAGCSVCTDSTDTGIYDSDGNVKIDSSSTFVRTNSGYNAYRMDVEGMKQVRWPGVASARIGAIFVDKDGTVIDTYNLTGMSQDSDFVDGEYVFTNVPTGAKYIIFAVKVGYTDDYALAVDSAEIEAIEPDWVEHKAELVGIYEAAMLNGTLRSVTGVAAKVGDGTSSTYTGWAYDNDGHVKDMGPLDVADLPLHYTMKDFQNLAWLRGEGYQMIDYETSKDVANLFFAIVGNRDGQAECGQGRSVGSSASNGWRNNYNTGAFDSIGKANSAWTSGSGNKVLGIENFMACNAEWMDNIAANIADYAAYKRNKMNPTAADPTDAVYHIFDPLRKTERRVQGINESGYCIGRVRFGRYADVIASKLTSDNSRWNQNYCDINYYTHSSGRVVSRSGYSANAYGGLVYSNAHNASSDSGTDFGTRLAFRGVIVIVSEGGVEEAA